MTRRKGYSVFHSRKSSLLFKEQGVQLIRKYDKNTNIIHVFLIYVNMVVPVSNLLFARYAQDFFKQLVSPTEFPRGKNFVQIYLTHILISNMYFCDMNSCIYRLRRLHKEDHEVDAADIPDVSQD